MTVGAWIGTGIGIFTFIISIGGLVWKMATLAAKVERQEEDLDNIVSKLDRSIDKTERKLEELAKHMGEINISVAKVAACISEKKCLVYGENRK